MKQRRIGKTLEENVIDEQTRYNDHSILIVPSQFHIVDDDDVTINATIPAQYFLYNNEIFEYVSKKIGEAIISPLKNNLKICYNVDTNKSYHKHMEGGALSVSLDQKWVDDLLKTFMNLEVANSNTYEFVLKHDNSDIDCVYSTIPMCIMGHPIKHNLYLLVKAAIEEYIEEYNITFEASLDMSEYLNPIDVQIQDTPGFLNCTLMYGSKNDPRFTDGSYVNIGIKMIKGEENDE